MFVHFYILAPKRLWDFINQREEDSQIRPHPLEESWDDDNYGINISDTTATTTTDDVNDELPSLQFGNRDWFWLTYEPDDEDIDWIYHYGVV